MTLRLLRQSTKILVVNPNSSESMTHGVEEAIKRMSLSPVRPLLHKPTSTAV
jgi:Asp/Glu/hydantoin racemase